MQKLNVQNVDNAKKKIDGKCELETEQKINQNRGDKKIMKERESIIL